MPDVLSHALAYASAGLRVFRLSKAKTPLAKTHGHNDATTDSALIREWFEGRDLNLGLACGDLIVFDFDGGDAAFESKWGASFLAACSANGGLPNTAIVQTRRGFHLYFRSPAGGHIRTRNEKRKTSGEPGIDIKAHGGYVMLPPSVSNGFEYRWTIQRPIAELPAWLQSWIDSLGGRREEQPAVALPPHLQGRQRTGLTERLIREPASLDDLERVREALAAIPPDGYDEWYQVGMALHSTGWDRPDGASLAFDLFDQWSQGNQHKYSLAACQEKWRSFGATARGDVKLGTLFHLAKQAGWAPKPYIVENVTGNQQPVQMNGHGFGETNGHSFNGQHLNGEAGPAPSLFRARSPDNPLIELNERFCVIGNLGGKVYVMEWVPSKADPNIEIPSYQSFKSFSERYANRYVDHIIEKTNKKTGETEREDKTDQLGTYWLKWHARRTYEGMDLDPNGPEVLEGNVLNLWKGFGVEAKPGKWTLMQRHITDVLAGGSQEQALYILRWAAWAVQNPGLQAEVALVLRGGKGVGKGTFAHALRRIFGQHGVYVSNSKHLVGQFNAHLRSCLLLFADEAFWAGDKQGESTLKSLITEAVVPIEKKGVDMEHVVNRLHIVMAANADWVVPASHDERRFAIFDIQRAPGKGYFKALREELENGGLEAMLHDLQHMDLGDWHPRIGIDTPALQKQKEMSLSPLADWFVGLLQDGYQLGREGRVPATALLSMCQQSSGRLRDVSPQTLGRFLKKHGVKPVHTAGGSVWEFGELPFLRKIWEKEFGKWDWDSPELTAWRVRS